MSREHRVAVYSDLIHEKIIAKGGRQFPVNSLSVGLCLEVVDKLGLQRIVTKSRLEVAGDDRVSQRLPFTLSQSILDSLFDDRYVPSRFLWLVLLRFFLGWHPNLQIHQTYQIRAPL